LPATAPAVWRAAADKMWKSATSDPKFALVEGGKFIKTPGNVDGKKFDIYTNRILISAAAKKKLSKLKQLMP